MTKTTRTSGWQHRVSVNRSLKRKPTSPQAAPTAPRRAALASGWRRGKLADRSRFFRNETMRPNVLLLSQRAGRLAVACEIALANAGASAVAVGSETTPDGSIESAARDAYS